jgi:hypothetical protein
MEFRVADLVKDRIVLAPASGEAPLRKYPVASRKIGVGLVVIDEDVDREVLFEVWQSQASTALRCHVNCAERSMPCRLKVRAKPASSSTAASRSAIASALLASNTASLHPMTSPMPELSAPITGAPLAIASSTGRPSPSYSDGNTNAAQDAYNATRSASAM